MTTALVLLTFALTHLAAVASPGPSFLLVLREAAAGGARRGLLVAFGLGLGTLIWAVGAWFGLAALFEIAPWLLVGLRWAGAAFLLYLSVMLWRHARAPVQEAEVGAAALSTSAIRVGLLTQLANPKVAVFFGSIFVVIVPPEPGGGMLLAIFVIVFANEFLWYALVALLMAAEGARRRYRRAKPLIDRITGTFLGALALRLLAN
ncbi:LysE family translocator [Pontivivens insulae]|uniref:Threonine efflux protein n=1 Tax=Pontivivens insulae TaxID=1639689 RepID=A0A2R8AEW5_9RHOB|nr:LysE family transporter [Pontivivens insulae]RED11981.1 threonine/homoserine/homoserine lactone efflux protein [Pontivivens insulae]SPF30737.1 Threonine efflux protein [Pontivivens insulae]